MSGGLPTAGSMVSLITELLPVRTSLKVPWKSPLPSISKVTSILSPSSESGPSGMESSASIVTSSRSMVSNAHWVTSTLSSLMPLRGTK